MRKISEWLLCWFLVSYGHGSVNSMVRAYAELRGSGGTVVNETNKRYKVFLCI
jgi:hypothetical protein